MHLVEEAVRAFGRVDGLVNAAGVAGGGAVHMVDTAEWNRVVGVNLYGTFLTAKYAIARMLDQPLVDEARGAVVTIASIEGIEGTAGGSAYSASKGGVVILTKNMAIDYAGRGIRVNTVCPGFIDTPDDQGHLRRRAWSAPAERSSPSTSWVDSASPTRSPPRRHSSSRPMLRLSPATPWWSTAGTPRAAITV